MDKAVNNSYPNQNLVKVKTINFFTFLFFLKFPNIWINIQKQTDLSILFIFYVFFFLTSSQAVAILWIIVVY